MWIFADHHPFEAVIMVFAIAGTIAGLGRRVAFVYNRYLRSKNIAARGWPTAPLMDADGDIVHPQKDN